MSSSIYNEGRVVGYSAYEVYVRHSLSVDPSRTPASELEWLSSSIAMGSSMLLKIPEDSTEGFHFIEVNLPEKTNLAAANTIIGSLFLGEAVCDSDGWAQKVTSYGPLLTNDRSYPDSSIENNPHTSQTAEQPKTYTSNFTRTQQDQILNYMNLVDGIVIQPGTWSDVPAGSVPPYKDLSPSMDDIPRVRILLSDKITTPFYLLLTGFTLRTVLQGVSGLDGSTGAGSVNPTDPSDTRTKNHAENGAFLGPGIFPWANKIVFSVPNSYIDIWLKTKYSRKLIKDGVTPSSFKEVTAKAITDIDIQSFTDYYTDSSVTHSIPIEVENARTVNALNVLTVYQRYSVLPPALYAHVVSNDLAESATLYPVDVVSPGTVKVYKESEIGDKSRIDKIKDLETNAPKNIGFVKDKASVLWEQNASGIDVQVADTYASSIYGTFTSTEVIDPYFCQAHNAGDPKWILLTDMPADWSTNNENYFYWDTTSSSYKAKTSSHSWASNTYFVQSYAVWFSAVMSRRISGIVNHQFKIDCGIGWSQDSEGNDVYNGADLQAILDAKYDTPVHVQSKVNASMYYDIESEGRLGEYYFVLSDGPNFPNGPYINSFSLIPVKIQADGSGKIDFVNIVPYDTSASPQMLWYVPSAPYFAGEKLNILGGYYESNTAGNGIAGHNTSIRQYIEDKIGQSVYVSVPSRVMPLKTYGNNTYDSWEEMYKSVKLNEIFTDSQLSNGIISSYKFGDDSGQIKTCNVHMDPVSHGADETPDYRNMTLYEFLQALKVHKRSDGSLIKNGEEQGYKFTMYIGYNKSYADAHSSEWKRIGKQDYYYPTSPPGVYTGGWQENAGAVRCVIPFNTSMNESNYQKSVIITIPEEYRYSGGPQAVVNIAGDHQTQSLSLTDANNNLYDLHGSNGPYVPSNGVLTWEDLITILCEGKSLDLFKSDRFYGMITLKMAAGDGIEFTDRGTSIEDFLRTISVKTNTAKGMAMNREGLYTNFAAKQGEGIKITKNAQNEIVITNTMPDYSNGNYKTLSTSAYTLNSPNKFTATKGRLRIQYAASDDKKTLAIKISFETDSNGIHAGNSNFGYKCYIKETGRDAVFNIQNVDGSYYPSTYNGTPSGGSIANSNAEGVFAFKHTRTSDISYRKANIINIFFTQDQIDEFFLPSSSASNAHGDRSKYKFEDTTGATSGIWNIENAERASWSASCGLLCGPSYHSSSDNLTNNQLMGAGADLTIIGYSYADGYNSQFPNSYNTGNSPAYSEHINLEVSGVFRYQG